VDSIFVSWSPSLIDQPGTGAVRRTEVKKNLRREGVSLERVGNSEGYVNVSLFIRVILIDSFDLRRKNAQKGQGGLSDLKMKHSYDPPDGENRVTPLTDTLR